jgi:beta-phosphoglucomutase-like phosphatase (HAD superfamily)
MKNRNGMPFFFDFDGVILDSVNVKSEAFATLFREFGADIEEKVVAYHLRYGGVSRVEKFRYYYRELLMQPLDDAELKRLCARFSELVVENF